MIYKKKNGILSGALAVITAAAAALYAYFYAALPQAINADCPAAVEGSGFAPVTLRSSGGGAEYCLCGIPIKRAEVFERERRYVIPGGSAFGITMKYDGVMIVGTADDSPAQRAGLKEGDVIISVNGEEVRTNEELGGAVTSCEGAADIVYRRGERELLACVTPALYNSVPKLGVYVRDSAAGIGTLSFIDPETGTFGGLGHSVSDISTGDAVPLLSGEISPAEIYDVIKGERGSAGELCGTILRGTETGRITRNLPTGVFGSYSVEATGKRIPAAFRQEVKTGAASMLTTTDGGEPREYSIEIERINLPELFGTRGMVIKVTDPELLERTGGIVRGMSGSPIIQNGRFAGAVTHVFLNDPTRGYAVFAETMLEAVE